jgi:hypothetical protein
MGAVLALLAATLSSQDDGRLEAILGRLAEEAEIFAQAALNLTAEETLQQRARKNPRRFRPRLGSGPAQPPKPEYQTREIVSEYGFTIFKEAPGTIHELRQVMAVDGRRIVGREQAREALARGVRSQDDRLKKRMLDQFRRYGLSEAAADFGQIILLFTARRRNDYHFRVLRTERLGADQAVVVDFQQKGGAGTLLIFQGKNAIHQSLAGEVWVRQGDWMPLRITLRSSRRVEKAWVRDEVSVEYAMSPHGVVAPASVVHRQWAGDELVVENLFRYTAFRRFAADVQVKY